jgi:hypothetical protein
MNYSEIQREVKSVLQDASPELLVTVPDVINEAIGLIAEEIQFPSLRSVVSVSTSTSLYYVNMPSGFSGRMLYCGNSDGERKILTGGLTELMELYPGLTDTGDVMTVALEGNVLYYQGMYSTATTLLCLIMKDPDKLVNDTDTPSIIPDYLHRSTIVNQTLAVCFSIIEDALEDKLKPNTKHWEAEAIKGLNELRRWMSRRRQNISRSVWSV